VEKPTAADRDLSMQNYLDLGPLTVLDIVRTIVPGAPKVHAVGYCLGGSLLAIAAAKITHDCHECLRTLTLLAAHTDFTEAGELMLFISDSQVAWLEDVMWDKGYLDTTQMVGAFQLLRSNDLVWSTVVRQYLLGEHAAMSGMMTWNSDATRMPYRMHSEYLHRFFLNNDLAERH
jgi:polyhydroxyalkanoate synthase